MDALLAAGAKADAANDDGITAADLARKGGHQAIVDQLTAEAARRQ